MATNADYEEEACQPLLSDDRQIEQSKAKHRWITVEPILLLSFIGSGTISTIRSEYLHHRIGIDKYNDTFSANDSSTTCITNSSDPDYLIQHDIQQDVSRWILYLSITGNLPLLFASIIFGSLSDTIGRKIALVIPLVGMMLQTVVYLAVISLHLPLQLLLTGEFIGGVTGREPLLLVASIAYVADISTKEQRTFRVVIVETVIVLSIGGAQLAMGYFIAAKGFVPPFYLILACYTTAIAYTACPGILYESIAPRRKVTNPSTRSRLNEVLHGVIDLFMYNVNGRRWRLILICMIFCSGQLNKYGYISVITLFVISQPFCWSSILVGIYVVISLILSAIGNVVGSKLFGLCLSDIWILHITMVDTVAEMLILGFAKQTLVVFAGAFFGCFRSLSNPILRSMASKSVSANEQGVMLSVLAMIECIATLCSPIVFQLVYAATVGNGTPGSAFLLAAGIGVLGTIFGIILHCVCWSSTFSRISNDIKSNQA